MIECKWCGAETIEISGDTWDTICRECKMDAVDEAAWTAEAEATGN